MEELPEPTCDVGSDCDTGWCGAVYVDDEFYSRDCVDYYDCDSSFTTPTD